MKSEKEPQQRDISIKGFEILEKIVKAQGTSGRVYVPPDWVGHQVAIIRLD